MRKFKEWTEADTIALDRLMKQGCSNKMIAKMLGRSESYIYQKKRELGFERLNSNKWTHKDEEELRKLYYAGYTDEEIGDKLNRAVSTIYSHRIELGYNDLKNIDWDEKYIQQYMIKQLKSAKSMDDAINKTGLSYQTIQHKLRDYFVGKIVSKELYEELKTKFGRRVVRI
ncbi:hypothetical protein [Clostridium thermobutyricum]|uniref:hypothetical protein n=1 Tax=Clostridium thermobutyricum TaxID=29372 RepID=UPI00294336FF|nr:hypothetical protein [Clostridium thermobutyricum]